MKSSIQNPKLKAFIEDYAIYKIEGDTIFRTDYDTNDFFEISLLLSGSLDIVEDAMHISLLPQSLLLTSPTDNVRRIFINREHSISQYVLLINKKYMNLICTRKTDLKQAFRSERSIHLSVLDLDSLSFTKILSALSTIYDNENSITFFGKDIVQRTLIQQLLVLINRVFANLTSLISVDSNTNKSTILEEQVALYISRNLQDELSNEKIASHFKFNKDHLNRRFKQYFGCSIHSFIIKKRLEYSTQLIKRGIPLNELARDSGFNDYVNFYKLFRQEYGVSPKEYKKKYTIF